MLIGFIVTTWLLAMLPGVGQALMLRQTLAHGPSAAVATIFGTATGLVIWTVAASAGLSAVVLAEPAVYRGLIGAGGAFLAFVGVRTLWAAASGADEPPPAQCPGRPGRRNAYLAGLVTNLGNPKAAVFAVSLLPGFAGSTAGAFWPTLSLGLVWSAVTACWYLVFVALVARGRALVTRPRAQRALGGASGIVLIGVGTAIAFGL
jgi:threonine/homoserine/homoserine lactone efflux protein